MRQLLERPVGSRPTAVFSASDFSVVGALQVLKEHGLRVPHDMALAGFSNEIFTAFTEPTISSVDQRCELMGQEAVRLLLEMLAAGTQPFQPRRIVLEPEVLIRESSVGMVVQ